jgi:hypothetical protein
MPALVLAESKAALFLGFDEDGRAARHRAKSNATHHEEG